jgi:hypothetical protein
MIEIIKSELLTTAGFEVHGFTKRGGGVSEGPFRSLNLAHGVGDDPTAVTENLERLKSILGGSASLLRVDQVHGPRVIDGDDPKVERDHTWTRPPGIQADGIVIAARETVIAVQIADCVPVLLADPQIRVVAAVHAGWRGLKSGVLINAVRAMIKKGCHPSHIIAAIGPCICLNCYEVETEVARHFPESSDPIPGSPGKHLVDLGLASEVSLLGTGLRGDHIERIDACTSCMNDDLFSYRAGSGTSGRLLAFISVDTGATALD